MLFGSSAMVLALTGAAEAQVAPATSQTTVPATTLQAAPPAPDAQAQVNSQTNTPADSSPVAAPTEQPTASDGTIGDIVVTALKRETSLQRTPVVIDVVQASGLERAGVANIAAIANIAPALNFGTTNGIYTTVAIRGVSSQDATELGDPAVAFGVDGEYINRPLNLSATLFDLERVEILRGPQGTLYGRNATAGAINIITKAPRHEFEAGFTGSFGNYNLRALQAYLNVPVTDWLAVRVSGLFNKRDGTIKHENGIRGDDQDLSAGRVSVLIDPTSNLKIRVTGEAVDSGGVGAATKGIVVTGAQPNGTLPTNLRVNIGDRDEFPVGIRPYVNVKQRAVRGTVTYDLGPVLLTDNISYRDTKLRSLFSFWGAPIWLSDFNNNPSKYQTFQNEFRVSGNIGGATVQAGYYYFHEDQQADINVYQNASPLLAPRDSVARLRFLYDSIIAKSNAFFGEVTVPIVDKLSITAGVRHTSDEKTRVGRQLTLNLARLPAIVYDTADRAGREESKRTNVNFVASYQATPANLIYAKYSTGYKAGGFDTIGSYGPEDLKAYEVGTKNRFLDNKLQFNAAFFYYEYTNQQIATLITLPNGTNASATQNAASNKPYGAELEAIYQATPDDRLRFTVDYLHSRFDRFVAALTTFGGATVNVDLKGKSAPYAPDLAFSTNYSHIFRMDTGDVTFNVLSALKTRTYLEAANYRSSSQPAFTKTDLTLTYEAPSKNWDVTAFVRNVEDRRTLRFAAFGVSVGQSVYRYQFSEPRTYGLTGSVRF